MREIIFRGKRLDKGEWLYWDCFGSLTEHVRINGCGFSQIYSDLVDPTTIGQFTGLLDKNGKRIWEGDIIDIGNGYHGIVIWDGFAWGLQIQEVNHTLYSWSAAVRLTEAIGNIHEPRGENDGE